MEPVVPQVRIIANNGYWQVLSDLARRKGLPVGPSFNVDYEKHLPRAKGGTLLIETHNGEPIVPLKTLHQFYPGASKGLKAPNGVVEVDGTTIMFVEFDNILDALGEHAAGE